MNPKLGGSYLEVFDRVASIAATGPHQVTITLRQPDYWLENELSAAAGITTLLEQARGTASLDKRAELVSDAEKLAAQQLPWIPTVQPDTVLLLGKGLTGAVSSSAYLYSPWASSLGGTG